MNLCVFITLARQDESLVYGYRVQLNFVWENWVIYTILVLVALYMLYSCSRYIHILFILLYLLG